LVLENCNFRSLKVLEKSLNFVLSVCYEPCLRLKCTKFDFGWGSAPDTAGGAYSAPPGCPLDGFELPNVN